MSIRHELDVVQCKDSRRILRAALEQGWEWLGYTNAGHVELRWPETGVTIHPATTPSDRHAWKNLARQIKRLSGIDLLPHVNHSRSRKSTRIQEDPEVEAQRRRYREAAEQRERAELLAEQAERRRRAGVAVAIERERRRREIEDLMQPGWGR